MQLYLALVVTLTTVGCVLLDNTNDTVLEINHDKLAKKYMAYYEGLPDDHPLENWTEELKFRIARHKATWEVRGTHLEDFEFTTKQHLWFNTAGMMAKIASDGNGRRRLRRDVSPLVNDTKELPKKLVRKEIRQLTPEEWTAYVTAVTAMKNNYPDEELNISEYDLFTYAHRPKMAVAAHDGAAFLPWHREHLWRFEQAMQKYSPGLGIPYWDTTLDYPLSNPKDAIIWTDEFFGPAIGNVTTGPFANWTVVPECEFIAKNLTRDYIKGWDAHDFLISQTDFKFMNQFGLFEKLVVGEDPLVETKHNSVHEVVGGHLAWISCSVSDPVFWLHHAFIDKFWEDFRKNHQTSDITKEYPSSSGKEIGGRDHEAYNYMYPFEPVLNIHGLSNHYTDYYYEYLSIPDHCSTHEDCGSDTLWCSGLNHCVSKVRNGGICAGLPNESCYGNGTCFHNICTLNGTSNETETIGSLKGLTGKELLEYDVLGKAHGTFNSSKVNEKSELSGPNKTVTNNNTSGSAEIRKGNGTNSANSTENKGNVTSTVEQPDTPLVSKETSKKELKKRKEMKTKANEKRKEMKTKVNENKKKDLGKEKENTVPDITIKVTDSTKVTNGGKDKILQSE